MERFRVEFLPSGTWIVWDTHEYRVVYQSQTFNSASQADARALAKKMNDDWDLEGLRKIVNG